MHLLISLCFGSMGRTLQVDGLLGRLARDGRAHLRSFPAPGYISAGGSLLRRAGNPRSAKIHLFSLHIDPSIGAWRAKHGSSKGGIAMLLDPRLQLGASDISTFVPRLDLVLGVVVSGLETLKAATKLNLKLTFLAHVTCACTKDLLHEVFSGQVIVRANLITLKPN